MLKPTICIDNSLNAIVVWQTYKIGGDVHIRILQDDTSNPDTGGTLVLSEWITVNYTDNQWYALEFIRNGVNVSIYIDGNLLYETTIPDRFLTLDMNVAIGGESYTGYDARISSLEYGNYQ